jgi:dephospho-CoA kinase
VFAGRAVIGIVGGIGSGKSFVASVFGQLGCLVVDSDRLVADAYREPTVLCRLREWWGDAAFAADGTVDRRFVASRIFTDPDARARLEALIHPLVHAQRERLMAAAAGDAGIVAFVWDTPLLFESGLHRSCDAVVFVEAPASVRLQRVQKTRGWDASELARREKSQWPLDSKREMSDYQISNAAETGDPAGSVARPIEKTPVATQVQAVLMQILARAKPLA